MIALMVGIVVVGSAVPAGAHQEWFVNAPETYPPDFGALLRPGVVLAVAATVAVTLLLRSVAARLPAPELAMIKPTRRLASLVPWVPRLLAAHLGFSLLVLAFDGAFLEPGIHVPDGAGGILLLVPQAMVGGLLIAGVLVRAASVAIMLTAPLLVALQGPEALVILAVFVGIAAFLFVLPPRLKDGGRMDLDLPKLRRATFGLKLGAGVTLISLAVVEKLANPEMARAMLEQEPLLNILAPFGVSADAFAVVAGSIELLFGLLIISGAMPQVVAILAAVPFTATLALFGTTEFLGHLPLYGVLLAFLVLGSLEETSRSLSGLRRRARTPVRSGKSV
ncbi:hypothetical protein [uncultured Corynebacterium sp.]|uniref:hypothetical protein n=1 Tax=uncultured Corynebacterium sp. TaxID=159447 RepID=UPI0025DCF2CC|nr:hypothetical protein [uncultured Corynebacterium sp.]